MTNFSVSEVSRVLVAVDLVDGSCDVERVAPGVPVYLIPRSQSGTYELQLDPILDVFSFGSSRITRVLAQSSTVAPRELGEQPTSGGARPGPVNSVPGLRPPGVLPVGLRIETIALDATIEQQQIENGVMQNPSGPFVVAWYKETGRLGEVDNNVVLAGHLDYWDVGPAIFYNLWKMEEGNKIEVTNLHRRLGKDLQNCRSGEHHYSGDRGPHPECRA